MQAPMLVMNAGAERDTGLKAQFGNIAAAKAVADIIRTTLGPRSMLKMILDPMGGIVMTNDGNSILREIDVNHPAAKSMIELSRTQDEEVGDGTTSVIIVAGEILQVAEPFLERKMHPRTIVGAFNLALMDIEDFLKKLAVPLDLQDEKAVMKIIRSTIGTKFVSRYGDLICKLALTSVMLIREDDEVSTHEEKKNNDDETEPKKQSSSSTTEVSVGKHIETSLTSKRNKKSGINIDLKRYARVERIPGGAMEDSIVLDGVMVNKDVLHPQMRRRIENPRVLCLDCALEYNKGESQTNIELIKENDFEHYLQVEEQYIEDLCKQIVALKPDVVTTEKGCSDLAQHYLKAAGVSVLRRVKKTDNIRIARAVGATVGNRPHLMKNEDVGTKCGLFEIRTVSDDQFAYFVQCKSPKACTIILRGGSKEVLQECERNLQDAMCVARNIIENPKILPGGGATEMAISSFINEKSKSVEGVMSWPYRAVANAIEIIPRTLINNCGQNPIKIITQLRAKHNSKDEKASYFGINGNTGEIVNMYDYGIWEPYVVKLETIKTAIESASMILRIDDVVSGMRNADDRRKPGDGLSKTGIVEYAPGQEDD